MRVTGKIVYAHTAGRVNYHRLGRIQPDLIFDQIVNGQPTGYTCTLTGKVVWDGPHAGQVAILPAARWQPGCDPMCTDVYYADIDWDSGIFTCHIPSELAYCCGHNEGETASLQLAGTVWTPNCVSEGYFGCPDSSYLETIATVKAENGGWLTLIRRVPAAGVNEFVLINQDYRIIDTVVCTEQAQGWSIVTERFNNPSAGTIIPLPGYVRDDLLYVCFQRNSGRFHCWMSMEYPFAPPDEQWVEQCYEKIQSRFYVLKMTPSGFQTEMVFNHLSGPLGECPACDTLNQMYGGGYTVMHAIPRPPGHYASGYGPGPSGTGWGVISLMCWNPAKVPGYKGQWYHVEAPLGQVNCGTCEADTSGKEFRYIDEVQFVRSGSYWHIYSGCFWKLNLGAPTYQWDYWYNYTVKYPTGHGEPLAMVSGDNALITTSGYKIATADGSVIKEIYSGTDFVCCFARNTEGNFLGQDRRTSPWKNALFSSDLDYIGPCCDDSDETLTRQHSGWYDLPAGLSSTGIQIPRNGGLHSMSFGGLQDDYKWRFCQAIPIVDNLDMCLVYVNITDCQLNDLSSLCDEGMHRARATFTIKTVAGQPVEGLSVVCEITDALNETQTEMTNGAGTVTFDTGCFEGAGSVTFTIESIKKAGHAWLVPLDTCSSIAWQGPSE